MGPTPPSARHQAWVLPLETWSFAVTSGLEAKAGSSGQAGVGEGGGYRQPKLERADTAPSEGGGEDGQLKRGEKGKSWQGGSRAA